MNMETRHGTEGINFTSSGRFQDTYPFIPTNSFTGFSTSLDLY
ncbi:hypothetical protein E2C01_089821 [Portunus trituberculatus]|uniref:Uncharacterized protein n=1 Tax=Portunus trituberculatus TaxID=210409 RepID=A0A5B7JJU5_PORTR|nr:hypothetical protein [Portunus trituberculatus]